MPRFDLKGKIQLDGSQWNSGLDQAKRKADKWSAETAGMIKGRLVSAFAVGAILSNMDAIFNKAATIRDESAKIGVDPETFQELDYAARQSGASIDDVGRAVKRLATAQQDAIRGSEKQAEAFARYGLTVDMLKRAAPEKLLALIAEQTQKGVNATQELADLQTLMGRGGPELIPTFKAGLSGAMAEARQIGPTFTGEQVEDLGRTADDITRAKQTGASYASKVYGEITESFSNFLTTFGAPIDTLPNLLLEIQQQKKLSEAIERNTRATQTNTEVFK